MKKSLSFIMLLALLITIVPGKSLAEESTKLPTIGEGSEIIITEEKEPSVDPDTLSNTATTIYESESSSGIQSIIKPLGLSFAGGTIACYTIGKNAYCPWTIKVKGDVITYSKVIVYLEKDYGFLKGGWKDYSTFSFKYKVSSPSTHISNEASFRLSKGSYRARLGGSFITLENGPYSAIANGASYFEIK